MTPNTKGEVEMKTLVPSRNSRSPVNSHDTNLDAADVLPRRTVLRGALAVGCSLLVPAALLACGRQTETEDAPRTSAPDEAGPSPDTASPAQADAKVSQASVQYQDQPKGDQQCSGCIHFVGPNACRAVEGEISPEGWCILWAAQS
jgi:hypothetical protein